MHQSSLLFESYLFFVNILQRIRFKKVCPKYDTDYNDYINNSEEMKGLNEKNKELFEYLANNSGVPVKNIDEIDDFYATLMVEV